MNEQKRNRALFLWWLMMLRPEDFTAADAAELLWLTRPVLVGGQ